MRRVLVVEDEVMIRLAIIDALEDAGFDVIEAASADDAMDILGEQTIHFLFTDVQMPGYLTGIDLAHAVAQRYPKAGILVASGRLTPRDFDMPSCAKFLPKPYDFSTIVERLNSLSIT